MKAFLLHNAGIKILALLAAVVSWLAIQETISFEVVLPDIPLEIRVAEGWAVLHQSEHTVRATFKGSQDDIGQMDPKQIKAIVDLRTNAIAGSDEIVVPLSAIKAPRNVRAIRVEPSRVQVSLDREQEKKVPVQSRAVGKPFSGEVEALICEPAVVTLRGPAQQLQQTEWVYTESVDVEGRVEGFTKRCRVLMPSDTWTPVIKPPEVQVNVIISERMETVEWDNVPVSVIVKPQVLLAVEVLPPRVRVVLTGSPETLEELQAIAPKAFVECLELDPSLTYDLPVQVFLPLGKAVSAVVEPHTVRVVVSKP
ncbi:MAG: CdaR family protein [Kiritimatiellota bacterium]|nr:CdaR family protein [Kiritimatiellota bacterium]